MDKQTAINALEKRFQQTFKKLGYDDYNSADERTQLVCDGISEAIDVIDTLPSASSDVKTGKWIQSASHYYCSECGEPCATYIMENPRDNFCKWCGADMRVKK